MHLTEYRNSHREIQRVDSLLKLLPPNHESRIDIGARDGFLSTLLLDYFPSVTALELEMPVVDDPRVKCIKGDATKLDLPSASINVVFCAEVLEHIPTPALELACAELARISKRYIVIGVPFKQDIRHGRTTCQTCGGRSPPWAHVNSFDEQRLKSLFPTMEVMQVQYVERGEKGTSALSAWLLNLAGNPFGTYEQDEACGHCEAKLIPPPARSFSQKVCTKAAYVLRDFQTAFTQDQANWIQVLFRKT